MKYFTRANRVVNLPTSELLTVLEDGGLIRPYKEPAPPPECGAVWNVGNNMMTGEVVLTVCCPRHGVTERSFGGIPENYHYAHCGQMTPVPKDIVQKFEELKKKSARVENAMIRTVR